jgi:hypothetical protein
MQFLVVASLEQHVIRARNPSPVEPPELPPPVGTLDYRLGIAGPNQSRADCCQEQMIRSFLKFSRGSGNFPTRFSSQTSVFALRSIPVRRLEGCHPFVQTGPSCCGGTALAHYRVAGLSIVLFPPPHSAVT